MKQLYTICGIIGVMFLSAVAYAAEMLSTEVTGGIWLVGVIGMIIVAWSYELG